MTLYGLVLRYRMILFAFAFSFALVLPPAVPAFTPLHYTCLQFFKYAYTVWPLIVDSQYCTLCFLTVWLESNNGIWRNFEGTKSLPLLDICVHATSPILLALFSLPSFLSSTFYYLVPSHCFVFYSFLFSNRLPCICHCINLWSSFYLISSSSPLNF